MFFRDVVLAKSGISTSGLPIVGLASDPCFRQPLLTTVRSAAFPMTEAFSKILWSAVIAQLFVRP